jgi:hypothetical protein
VTFEETIAKSVALDRHLKESVEKTMGFGTERLMGDLGGLFQNIQKTLDEAKTGIAGAASELMLEVKGLNVVEKAIRKETDSVRKFKVDLLGNAADGENADMKTEAEKKIA